MLVYSNFAFRIMSLSIHVRTCDFKLIQERIRPSYGHAYFKLPSRMNPSFNGLVILFLRVVEPVHSMDFEILVQCVVEPVHFMDLTSITPFGASPST